MVKYGLIFITILFCSESWSQEPKYQPEKKYVYSSYSGLNSDPDLFNDISLNAYELLNTNIQFSKNEDLQKIVFTPFRLIPLDSIGENANNFLYNTKLNLAQKGGVSTIGVGFTWDNSLPNTKRGDRILKGMSSQVDTIKKETNKSIVTIIKKDIINAKSGKLKYVLSPQMIIFLNSTITRFEDNILGASLFPLERSDFINKPKHYKQNSKGDLTEVCICDSNEANRPVFENEIHGCTYEDFLYYQELYKKWNDATKNKLDNDFTNEYYQALLKNSIKLTLGGNYSYFGILGGDDVDLDNNMLNDNEYSVKQKNLSASLTYIANENWGFNTSLYFLNKRAAAEDGNDLQPYFGFSTSLGFKILNLNKDYKSTKEYKDSFFIPSIHSGFAFEYLECNAKDGEDCDGGILKTYSFTPFIEFKINPKNQFRIGLPLSKIEQLNENKNEIGPFFQWRLQLAGK